MIIIINGRGGVGKDTFVKFCMESPLITFIENMSTIEPIKGVATMLGWDQEKTPEARKFLSDLKDLSSEFNDFPYQFVIKRLKDRLRLFEDFGIDKFIIFIHSREPEEIARFVKDLGAKTLLIKRNTNEVYLNHADLKVENYRYDYTIENNGILEEFRDKAIDFVYRTLKKEGI